jgi:hypothetical protein
LSSCNILSDECLVLSLMNKLGRRQMHDSHIYHVTVDLSFFTICKSFVSPGLRKHVIAILLIISKIGSLVTWTVVSLFSAKFKPFVLSVCQSRSESYVMTAGQ